MNWIWNLELKCNLINFKMYIFRYSCNLDCKMNGSILKHKKKILNDGNAILMLSFDDWKGNSKALHSELFTELLGRFSRRNEY